MPNHFHVLLFLSHTGTALNTLVGECKRFMAYDIVGSLRRQGKESLLQQLQSGVQKREKVVAKFIRYSSYLLMQDNVLAKR